MFVSQFQQITSTPFWYQCLKEVWFMFTFIFWYFWAGLFYRLPIHPQGDRQPVVLVPGFLGKGLEFHKLRQALIEAGYPVYVVPLGFQMGTIEGKWQKLGHYLDKHQLKHCIVLAYSMGGWVASGLPQHEAHRIDQLITIGVAFQGTPMAYLLPFCRASWQLMPHSSFIKKNQSRVIGHSGIHINIIASGDEVAPPQYCKVATARQVVFPEFGHLNLIMGQGSIESILNLLENSLTGHPQEIVFSKAYH